MNSPAFPLAFPLALLNTTIATSEGWYDVHKITKQEAIEIFNANSTNFISAIGHETTAMMLNTIFNTDLIKTNRIEFNQQFGQQALCFKLKGRPLEGKILDINEIEQIGYEFVIMDCIAPNSL